MRHTEVTAHSSRGTWTCAGDAAGRWARRAAGRPVKRSTCLSGNATYSRLNSRCISGWASSDSSSTDSIRPYGSTTPSRKANLWDLTWTDRHCERQDSTTQDSPSHLDLHTSYTTLHTSVTSPTAPQRECGGRQRGKCEWGELPSALYPLRTAPRTVLGMHHAPHGKALRIAQHLVERQEKVLARQAEPRPP